MKKLNVHFLEVCSCQCTIPDFLARSRVL